MTHDEDINKQVGDDIGTTMMMMTMIVMKMRKHQVARSFGGSS